MSVVPRSWSIAVVSRVAAFGLALLVGGAPSYAADPSTTDSPRLLVHLLDYLSKDYAGAVSDGKVTNELEYREQVEFAQEAVSLSGRLSDLQSRTAVLDGIKQLGELVSKKAPPEAVSALALKLKSQVIEAAHIAQSPTDWPDLRRGRVLYQQNCVACHGERGAGDGPAAAALQPHPTNFVDAAIGSELSPFRAFNTIRVGIPGTAMAPWPTIADEDVWALAFYVTSLHVNTAAAHGNVGASDLTNAATRSDRELMTLLPGSDADRAARVAALRLHSGDASSPTPTSASGESNEALAVARTYLHDAETAFADDDYAAAKHAALLAYLEGIEPVEPQLRATDAEFVGRLESSMAAVRSAIDNRSSLSELKSKLATARALIDDAEKKLSQSPSGPWVTFLLTVGILLREGFEAVLILIALLAVIRASDSKDAARWVHAGWASALGVGVAAWFFSGWLMAISGAQREMLEGVTALLAVAVLLYVGFWLHSRTEITRWTQFIDVQVKNMLSGRNLWGLAAIAFMAVFREAFETVLFMRALTLEGGQTGVNAMLLGAVLAIGGLATLSWLLLKYSARLPIRTIFTVSSALMVILAVILTGKGLHALQETGTLSVSVTPWQWSTDVFGVYASWQPIIGQLAIAAVVVLLWRIGSRPTSHAN